MRTRRDRAHQWRDPIGADRAIYRGASLDQLAPLGDYTVSVTVAGRTLTTAGKIVKTQGWSIGQTPTIIR
jgi:hypothetical protein